MHISTFQQCQELKRIKGLPTIDFKSISICESYLFGKMSHQPFAKSKIVTEFSLQYIHIDMCGPFPVASLSKVTYFISIIDNTSNGHGSVLVWFLDFVTKPNHLFIIKPNKLFKNSKAI